jgi:hypothetical protein
MEEEMREKDELSETMSEELEQMEEKMTSAYVEIETLKASKYAMKNRE